MPQLTKALPKYRLHKASGQAVVTLAGRDFYLGPHGTASSRTEYDRVVAEWLTAGRPPCWRTTGQVDTTVVEVIVAFVEYARQRYVKDGRPTSEQERVDASLRPVKNLYGRQRAVDFGPLALKAVRQQMVGTGLARSTVNQNVSRIKRMFRWAASEELIPVTTYQALATVSGLRKGETSARETKPVPPVDQTAIDAILPHLSPVVADMVRLQRLTGMRPGEVCIIRPRDIEQTGEVWRYLPESHKTEHHDRNRTVFIGPRAQNVIACYLNRSPDEYCFSPADSERIRSQVRRENRVSPLTPSQKARVPKQDGQRRPSSRYDTGSYRTAVARACRKAKITVWSPNQLRHTTATEIRRSFGLEAAQVVLGHSRADVTQVYAERDARLAEDIARQTG